MQPSYWKESRRKATDTGWDLQTRRYGIWTFPKRVAVYAVSESHNSGPVDPAGHCPAFSEQSTGLPPGHNTPTALLQPRDIIDDGYAVVVPGDVL